MTNLGQIAEVKLLNINSFLHKRLAYIHVLIGGIGVGGYGDLDRKVMDEIENWLYRTSIRIVI